MQIKNYIDVAKLGLLILTIVAFQAQALLAETIPSAKSALRAYTDVTSVEAQDILWLARILYSESKVREEQIVVAWVVRNRVETGFREAESYKDVATDPKQFSGIKLVTNLDYSDTSNKSWQDSLSIARAVYFADASLRPIAQSVRHFYSPEAVIRDPLWIKGQKPTLLLRDNEGTIRFAFYDNVR